MTHLLVAYVSSLPVRALQMENDGVLTIVRKLLILLVLSLSLGSLFFPWGCNASGVANSPKVREDPNLKLRRLPMSVTALNFRHPQCQELNYVASS
jgi:hypothetical protein